MQGWIGDRNGLRLRYATLPGAAPYRQFGNVRQYVSASVIGGR